MIRLRQIPEVLRESLIRLSQAITVQENRGEKMALLYDYLTGNEFRLQVEAIVEGFSQMQADLSRERNAMHRHWRQREKQIEKVMVSTAQMYGSIRGIAGSAVRALPLLELPGSDRHEEESEETGEEASGPPAAGGGPGISLPWAGRRSRPSPA